jgi:hypothetical protein
MVEPLRAEAMDLFVPGHHRLGLEFDFSAVP